MDTLIELYDERAIENVLAADMFRPQRIVYLCPTEVAQSRERQEQIGDFFRHRGWNPELIFLEASLYKVDRILRQLLAISEKYPDCAMDVTGGSDAELFAAGLFAAKANVRVFTYSRRKNRFYNISGAEFAENLPCDIQYSVKDFFLMAGGTLLPGRVDNAILKGYLDDIDPFFGCFLQHRRDWNNIITYMQRVSPSEYGQVPSMHVQGNYTVKGERGGRISAKEEALQDFQRIGFLRDLDIVSGEKVSFRFRDVNTRAWLRDVGSVLELYVYKACMDAGIEMSEVLQEMGMTDAFDWQVADFSRLGTYNVDGLNICINRVLHETFISVTEHGTRAGAATAVEMVAEGAAEIIEYKEVVMDRPFVYMLMDCETNLPFFIGTMMNVNGD